MNKKHIGQRVKLARIFYEQKTGNKMTQEILANKIGTKRGTIGDIELGRSYPSIEMAYKITQACGVTLDFLVSEELKAIPKELNDLGIEYVAVTKELKDKGLSAEDIRKIAEVVIALKKPE
jgi:transcriptional regulator with XRE-family HTH domain